MHIQITLILINKNDENTLTLSYLVVQRDGPDGQATFGLLTFSAPDQNSGWLDCVLYSSDQNGYSVGWLHLWSAISSGKYLTNIFQYDMYLFKMIKLM